MTASGTAYQLRKIARPAYLLRMYLRPFLYPFLIFGTSPRAKTDGETVIQRTRNNCQRPQSTNCCVTKLVNTDGKGGSQTQSFFPIINNEKEENLFGSSIQEGAFTEAQLQSSGNNDEEYFGLSEDHDETLSNPTEAFTFSSFEPLIASTGDGALSYSTNGDDLNEEASLFSPGR